MKKIEKEPWKVDFFQEYDYSRYQIIVAIDLLRCTENVGRGLQILEDELKRINAYLDEYDKFIEKERLKYLD